MGLLIMEEKWTHMNEIITEDAIRKYVCKMTDKERDECLDLGVNILRRHIKPFLTHRIYACILDYKLKN